MSAPHRHRLGVSLVFSFHYVSYIKNAGAWVLLYQLTDKVFINLIFVWTSQHNSVQHQPGCRAYDNSKKRSGRKVCLLPVRAR